MALSCPYFMRRRGIWVSRFPDHILDKTANDRTYYSLDSMDNIERAKVDPDFLGDVLVVNENLIWHSIHKYCGKPEAIVNNYCIEKDDIIQLGRIGFIKAIKAFDTGRGVKFSSFAVTAIVREIKCFLRDSASIIRPTRTANELIQRIGRIENELGFLPSVEDLSLMLDEPDERITKALRVGQPVKYLDEPCGFFEGALKLSHLDLVIDGSDLESVVVDKVYADSIIETVRDRLSQKELAVLMRRASGLNQTQTADKENISQMRVSSCHSSPI
jgi:RNA polymerase sporulation-specific sigma factor